MMMVYNVCTWTAIVVLAIGSIAVFATFLVTTLRQLRAERNPAAKPSAQEKTKLP